MSINIETDLKEILTKIDNRLDKIDQRFEKLETKINEIQVSVAEQRKDTQRLEEKIDSTSKRLEEKIDGLSKRVDNAEFINRGVFVGLLLVILGGAAKLLGLFNNP